MSRLRPWPRTHRGGSAPSTPPDDRFRDGASGRRAGLIGGPDVWEVVGGLVGGDVPPGDRIARAAEHLGLSHQQIDAVLDYYADFTTEIDEEIADNVAAADQLKAAWRRRQGLLAG